MGVEGGNPYEAQFKVKNNEEVNFLANQGGHYRAIYHRFGENQGWNRDEGWRDHDRDWHNRNATWKERERENDGYILPMSIKSLKILRVSVQKTCSHTFLTRLKGSFKF